MAGTENPPPGAPHPPNSLSRALAWAIVTVATILRDSLDRNGTERRRRRADRNGPLPDEKPDKM